MCCPRIQVEEMSNPGPIPKSTKDCQSPSAFLRVLLSVGISLGLQWLMDFIRLRHRGRFWRSLICIFDCWNCYVGPRGLTFSSQDQPVRPHTYSYAFKEISWDSIFVPAYMNSLQGMYPDTSVILDLKEPKDVRRTSMFCTKFNSNG